ncbi:hypothetical protein [Ferroplasma sp.]|uniref:hypothetical protein n=1 Tax=Ferroplasma sp. TaxID=2591003 RepID=UPI00307D939E
MKIQIGKGTLDIDEKIINLTGNKVISISIVSVQGACTDNMCPLIKKTVCTIVDNYILKNSFKAEYPVKIEIADDVYYSIDKERQNVKLKSSFNKKIEVKGLSLVSAV